MLMICQMQVFPTNVRSFGLGVNNALSRLGALLSPYLTVDLARSGHMALAEGIIATCCLVAGVMSLVLPTETAGRLLLARLTLTLITFMCA